MEKHYLFHTGQKAARSQSICETDASQMFWNEAIYDFWKKKVFLGSSPDINLYFLCPRKIRNLCQSLQCWCVQCGLSSQNMVVRFVLEGSQLKSTGGKALCFVRRPHFIVIAHRTLPFVTNHPRLRGKICSQPTSYVEQVLFPEIHPSKSFHKEAPLISDVLWMTAVFRDKQTFALHSSRSSCLLPKASHPPLI